MVKRFNHQGGGLLTPACFVKAKAAPAKARATPAKKRKEARESSSDEESGELSHHFKYPDHLSLPDFAPSLPSFLAPPEPEVPSCTRSPGTEPLDPKYQHSILNPQL